MPTPASPLIYRAPNLADTLRLFEIYSDPRTQAFNPAGPMTRLDQARALLDQWFAHWAEHGYGWWAIAEGHAPERVIGFGGIGAYPYLKQWRINLGYRFAVEAWGRGHATRLGRDALARAFGALSLAEVFALVRPDHGASIRVLEKVGMRRHGELDDVPGKAPSLVFKAQRE